ncbi:hypothetical protein [Ideonella sp. A 288]|uniref:hypothetical protein n=1 Tax=Ideonella sp. A 288 TaxID=1962181 RepID=UPI000B4B135E|nr:hypothetical protein [Ideonella sp. A 288]
MVTFMALQSWQGLWRRIAPGDGLRRMGRSLWNGLERHGRLHAARELQVLAQNCESTDPARARRLREAIAYMVIP